MNQYAAMAERHWRRWLPSRVAELEDPSSFFSTLGDDVANRIAELTDELAGDDPLGDPRQHYQPTVQREELTEVELNAAALSPDDVVLDLG